jgi:hypothetical protein
LCATLSAVFNHKPATERDFSKLVKPKTRQVRQFTEAGFANLTAACECDAFHFGNQDMTPYRKSHEGDTPEQS